MVSATDGDLLELHAAQHPDDADQLLGDALGKLGHPRQQDLAAPGRRSGKSMCRNRQRRLSASDSSRVALEVSTTNGGRSAVMVPSSGTVTWKSDSTSSSRPSISMSALSVSSMSSTVGFGAPDRGQQRPREQELLAEDVVLVRVPVRAARAGAWIRSICFA